MKTNKRYSENEIIVKYENSLDIVKSKKTIQDQLSKFGYTAELIAEGQTLLHVTMNALKKRDIQYNKKSEASQAFKATQRVLSESYNLHRKIAKVIFRKDDISLKKLALIGSIPLAYEEWLEIVFTFYVVATSDSEIQSKLARHTLTPEKLGSVKYLIASIEANRGQYLYEKAKAEESTKIKNDALAEMDDWMTVFYTVAKLAIEDQELLQLTLGKPA
ncbi:MAG: hypothetical protein PF450_14770 [Bacteroidales bacterium]|jgi:hypothetical protein|nr:hypothetical protein [Bacteroidales bacterium]